MKEIENNMQRVTYGGWPNCYRLASGDLELIVSGDVGPRIIRLGFVGEENEFAEFAEHLGQTGGAEWRIYGGHRLWHAPEDRTRSYFPDNEPIEVKDENGTLRVAQPPETTTGIQKELAIKFQGPHRLTVRHYLRNVGLWPVELAPWALSVMAPDGIGIVPQPTKAHPDGLLPNRVVVLWPYTDMTDGRLHWGSRFILLRQDQNAQTPAKLGLSASDGWGAYLRQGHLFLKVFEHVEAAAYPDHGCSLEMYTNNRMLELETLGPLQHLAPGDAVEHLEHWFLFRGVEAGAGVEFRDEDSIAQAVLPLVAEAQSQLSQ
jgi:hypothetical protein